VVPAAVLGDPEVDVDAWVLEEDSDGPKDARCLGGNPSFLRSEPVATSVVFGLG
jgi:hypothetical protein